MDITFDEAFSYLVAKEGLGNLTAAILFDNHPPLYFVLLHYWMKIFGENELVIRFPSILFGILTAVSFYLLLQEIFDKSYAIKGTIILTLLPSLIYFSIQVRMYSLFVFLSLLSTFFLLKLLKRFEKRVALLFITVLSLTIFTHYYGYLLLIPYFLMIVRKRQPKYFLMLFIPLSISLPWVYRYLTTSHPGTFIQNSLIAIPATFASLVVDPVTLTKMFASEAVLAKLLFLSTFTSFFVILLMGIKGIIKDRKLSEYLILLFSPIVFLFFANLLIPVFSVRPTFILIPYFLVISLFGLKSYPKDFSNNIYLSLVILLILLNIAIRVSSDLRGLEIKRSMNSLSQESVIYHTSILTYYPFRYYDQKKQNFLLTHNPLSHNTIEIIGGIPETIPHNLPTITIVDTKNGADVSEVNSLLVKLKNNYKMEKATNVGDITIYYFTPLPSPTTKLSISFPD